MPDEPAKGEAPEPAKEPESKTAGNAEGKVTTVTVPEPAVAQADNPDAVKRALDAERKAAKEAAKRAEAAEAKLAEREEADKSELEKAQGKLTKAEQAAAEANAKLLRYEVAQEKEIPAKLVPLLTATEKEDLEAQADLILENAKTDAKPDFDGGARDPAPEPKTPEQAHGQFLVDMFRGKSHT